ncbi:MAG: shikimate dehydrogenase [Rhizobiaceae bacterium]|nr:shikimate dehydrogenase [Rhizobiaceae bacterium]
MANVKKAFVTGWPVDHSRSPLIHNYWLKKNKILGEYLKRPCPPEDLQQFLTNLEHEGFVGGNITVPHKEAAFDLVDKTYDAAQTLEAVNTVWLGKNGLQGTNTDGYGFLANLDDRHPGWDSEINRNKAALVLGAGGASRAVIYALMGRGFSEVVIANRTLARADALVEHFGPPCRAIEIAHAVPGELSPAIIINTTSIGMNDQKSPLDLKGFASTTIVHDIVYSPLITPLLAQAGEFGMPIVDGLGMLLHQAVPGFEKWFGIRPEVDEPLRKILLDDLGEAP